MADNQFLEQNKDKVFKFHSWYKKVFTYKGEGFQVFGEPHYHAEFKPEMKLKDIIDWMESYEILPLVVNQANFETEYPAEWIGENNE